MGVVYRAWHRIFQREAALKVLIPALALKERVRARFRQEAYLQAQLEHPHIIRVRDFIEDGDTLALAMDLVEGPDLAQVLETERTEPWSFEEMFLLIRPVLNAIGYAHTRNVVHRDIKPANILLDRGDGTKGLGMPRITDFGLGKIRDDGDVVSLTGAKMGTLPYMAPEQFRGKKGIDARADVFALGILVWRLLAGGFPFDPDDQVAVLEFYTGRTPLPRLDAVLEGLPDGLADLLEAVLSVDKEPRPADARTLLEALKGIQANAKRAPAQTPPAKITPVRTPAVTEAMTQVVPTKVPVEPPTSASGEDATETRTNLTVPVSAVSTTPQVSNESSPAGGMGWIPWMAAAAVVAGALFLVVRSDSPEPESRGERPQRTSNSSTPDDPLKVAVQQVPEIISETLRQGIRSGIDTITGEKTADPKAPKAELRPEPPALLPVPDGMVMVPAGSYGIGCLKSHDQECFDDEAFHVVELPAFAIMQLEVTMEQYDICIADEGCPKPKLGGHCNWQVDGRENHPINCVTWTGAKTYCEARGWRLPTEEEWEAAARGTIKVSKIGIISTRRDYPWGRGAPSCEGAVVARDNGQTCRRSPRSGRTRTDDVGTGVSDHTGAGTVQDLGGSVREWTSTDYGAYPGGEVDADSVGKKVNRGGSWAQDLDQLSTSHTRTADSRSERRADLGFRCAMSLEKRPSP